VCVCVCVCVSEREREREHESQEECAEGMGKTYGQPSSPMAQLSRSIAEMEGCTRSASQICKSVSSVKRDLL
jgi:uncharacterized protein YhaN